MILVNHSFFFLTEFILRLMCIFSHSFKDFELSKYVKLISPFENTGTNPFASGLFMRFCIVLSCLVSLDESIVCANLILLQVV